MWTYSGWRVLDALTFGPWRRRRRLAAQLRERSSPLYQQPARPRQWTPGPRERSGRLGGTRPPSGPQLIGLLAIVALIAVAATQLHRDRSSGAGLSAGPVPGGQQHEKRLDPAVPEPAGSGGYAFELEHRDGSPVTYDPCHPIHYVVDPAGSPRGSRPLLAGAVARVEAATGLRFIDDGSTSEAADEHREPVQVGRYGNRWVPVLIAWSDATHYPPLAGTVAGIGGSTRVGRGDDVRYVTGQIVLDRDAFDDALTTPADTETLTAVLLHELGHVVGLAHVPEPTELMYKETVPGLHDYRTGDLRGLALVGSGRCDGS